MGFHRFVAPLGAVLLFLFLPRTAAAQTVNAGTDVGICAGGPITLGGSPTATGGTPPYTYSWTPATGLSATNVANPVCTATGTTTYTLTVNDANPGTPPVTDQVTVSVSPNPTILLTSPNAEQSTTYNGLPAFSLCQQGFTSFAFDFTDASTATPGSTYVIDWGNGNTSTFPNAGWSATQTYNLGLTQGTYTITQPNGCTRTTQFYVFIGGVPLGGLSVVTGTSICTGQTIDFQWNNIGTNPPGTSYIIDFGDGQTSNVPHPPPAVIQHTYALSSCDNGGEFSAAWRIQNPCDTRTGQLDQIRVSESPQAVFTVVPNDTVCLNTSVTFTDQSIGQQAPTCTDPKRVWSISPGTYTLLAGSLGNTGATPALPATWTNGTPTLNVQFTAPGTYTISDRTGNACGQNTLSRTICVEAPPQPSFTLSPATGCTPLVSTTDNTSTSPNSCLTRYQWSAVFNSGVCASSGNAAFTGGTNASSLEPQFTFTGAGSYTITLQAINSCGTFQATQPVTVGAPPQVTMNPVSGICAGQTVTPSASFTACGSPITNYSWSLPGGTPASASTANLGAITYGTAGNFTITATANSACGPGSANTPLTVTTLPPAPTVNGPITLCAGQTLNLTAANIPGATFHWTGPNGFDSFQQDPSIANITAAGQGTYTVSASSGGCSGPSAQVQVTVTSSPVVSILPANPSICAGASVTLTANGAGNYQWTVGGGAAGTGASLTITPTGTTTVAVTGDLGGCPGTATTTVTVNPLPAVNAGPDRAFCAQPIAEPLFPGTPGGTWSGPNVTAGGVFTPTGPGTFTLTYTVTSVQNCPNTDQVTITVDPPPTPADAGNDTLICQNSGPLQLVGAPSGGTWSGPISAGGLFTPGTNGTFPVTYATGTGSCASSDQAAITVVPATAVNAGNDAGVCIDAPPFTLGGLPTGGTWNGAGVASGIFDPVAAGLGPHTLTYTYVDVNGCMVSDQRVMTVDPLPVVDAGTDPTFCDQPFPQTLTASPAGGTWSGPIVTPGGSFTPAGTGVFALTYTYTDIHGCAGSDGLTVTVVAITNPATAGNDTAVCINSGALQLNGGPAGGTWSGPFTSAGGVFDPTSSGTFTAIYSVGTGSCITQDQVSITVHPLPVLAITSSTAICLDGGLQPLTATPTGGTWSGTGVTDAVAGTFDPAVSGAGSFPITYSYTDGNGCSNSTQAMAMVNPLPTAAFSHDPIACVGAPFPFTDGSSGATGWQWDFGDGGSSSAPSPAHTYAAVSTYTVTLTVSTGAGCTNTTTSPVTVWEGPTVGFSASPTEGCAPLVVTLDNGSFGDGVSHAWDFGNGSTSTAEEPGPMTYLASPTNDTTYTITLAATNLCATVTATQAITVHPSPTALFGPDLDHGCSPWPVTFSNVTIGQADSYLWDFGDGHTSTTLDSLVHHTYVTGPNDTTFTITLTATNACGTDVADYTVTVLPNTITAFFNTDTTSGCAPLTVQFTQYSIGVTHWHWELGDGNVSTDADVTNTYTEPGTYTATLFGDNGCSYDTVSVTITVLPSPDVSFSVVPATTCAGLPFQFINGTPDIADITWDFGDGSGSDLTDPVHTYPTAGTYPVTLAVISSLNACPASLTQPVTVQVTPVAAFTPAPLSGCIPLDVQFANTSVSADFYQWDFGDGNTISGAEPLHTYTTAGSYTIRLVAENLNGCRDTAYADVVAFPLPTSAFTFTPGQSCTSPVDVQFVNGSSGEIDHVWDFGNGQTSLLNDPLITYAGPGTYPITLTVTNQYGCADVSTHDFTVHPTPVAAFTPEPQPGCAGYPITFTNGSLNSNSYEWLFSDGGTSTEGTPLHIFEAGDYDVTLIATGAGGCTDTLSVTDAVHIDPSPTAAFSYVPMESVSYALQFHNSSEDAISWRWDFGDGSTSAEFEPLHLFPAGPNDFYPLCLVAINSFGCPDTTCEAVHAASDPDIYAPNAFTPDQDGLNESFVPVLNGFDDWRYRFLIFDRWGEVIHDSRDRYTPWDGNSRGIPCKTDVYVWKVILNKNGDEREYIGHVTLVRGDE